MSFLRSSVAPVIVVSGLAGLLVSSACADGDPDPIAPLSGVGPIGAGGGLNVGGSAGTAGTAGTAGSAGSSGSSGTAGAGGTGAATLPTKIRLANTVFGSSIKVCVGDAGPFPAAAIAFGQMSEFTTITATGDASVKVIEATKDCSDAGLGSKALAGATTKDDITIAYFDTTEAASKVNAFDNHPLDPANSRLRAIHGVAAEGPIDLGLNDAGTITAVFTNIGFGKTATEPTLIGDLPDSGGYLAQATVTGSNSFGAADTGNTAPFVTTTSSLNLGESITAFVVGKKGDATNPAKFMICQDFVEASGLTTCTLQAD